jgi:hypothetical protein
VMAGGVRDLVLFGVCARLALPCLRPVSVLPALTTDISLVKHAGLHVGATLCAVPSS